MIAALQRHCMSTTNLVSHVLLFKGLQHGG
jgi:hypothetical protein